MKRWLLRSIFATMLVGMTPVPAAAQFWEVVRWLNDMSGPQMWGGVAEIPVRCYYDGGARRYLFGCAPYVIETPRRPQTNPPLAVQPGQSVQRRELALGFRVGYLSNIRPLGNETETRDIDMFVLAPFAFRYTVPDAPWLDFTGAFELGRFQGSSTPEPFWLPTLQVGGVVRPVSAFYPGEPRADFFGISVVAQQFFGEFDGAKFNAPGTFESSNETIFKLVFVFDISKLVKPVR